MANILEQAIAKIQEGDQEAGRHLLTTILKDDPHNEQAWFWLSRTVELDEQRRECLENVLKLNPDHKTARAELSALPLSDATPPPLGSSLAREGPILLIVVAIVLYLFFCGLGTTLVVPHLILGYGYGSAGVIALILLVLSVEIYALLLMVYKQRSGTRLSLPKSLGLALVVLIPLLGWIIYASVPLFVPHAWTPWLPASAELIGCRPACQGIQLPGSVLTTYNLREVDLRQANLQGADLNATYLEGANLSGADLSGADLTWAYLNGANLNGANLNGADLSGAHLSGVTFDDQTQIEARWRLVAEIVTQGAAGRNLSGSDLREANLTEANLSEANLSGADLREATLAKANLRGANLHQANLYHAELTGADLRESDLSEANLGTAGLGQGTDLRNANLRGASLRGAYLSARLNPQPQLSGADLSGADLSGAVLYNVDLSEVKYDSQTIWPAGISPP